MKQAIVMFTSMGALALCLWCSIADAGWKPLPINRNQATQQLRPRKIAMVIGINSTQARYWTPLLYARRDATMVAQTLQQTAQFDQILLRVGRADTSKAALWKAVKQLHARVKSPLDTVFVYVSAHGTVALNPKSKQQERYIVTSDTNQNTDKSAINVKQLVSALKRMASKRVVLMLATCYTGSPRSKSRTKPGRKGAVSKNIKPLKTQALQILSASGFAQAAFESTKLRSDVYTHFFLDCLRKLKRTKGKVSTIDAHICAARPTTGFVKRTINEIQVPGVDSQPGANRDIFLVTPRKRRPNVGYFWGGRKNRDVRYELRRGTNAKGPMSRVHWASPGEYIGVRPGQYRVVIRDRYGRILRYYTVTIRRQHTTYLRPEMYRDPYDTFRRSRRIIVNRSHPMVIVGYTMGSLITLGAGATIGYGVWVDRPLAIFTGGMLIGAGSLILLTSLAIDFALYRNQRRILYLRSLTHQPVHTRPRLPGRIPPPGYGDPQLGSFR